MGRRLGVDAAELGRDVLRQHHDVVGSEPGRNGREQHVQRVAGHERDVWWAASFDDDDGGVERRLHGFPERGWKRNMQRTVLPAVRLFAADHGQPFARAVESAVQSAFQLKTIANAVARPIKSAVQSAVDGVGLHLRPNHQSDG